MIEKKTCKLCGCELGVSVQEASPVLMRAWKRDYEHFYKGENKETSGQCVRYTCPNGEPSHEDYFEMLWPEK